LVAFAIPFGNGDRKSTSYILQHWLHKPVSFLILPLFALANTGIVLGSDWLAGISTSGSIGIISGLAIGKPLGILLFCFLGTALGLCTLPRQLKWTNLLGAGALGGIGFTMSIFITLLAFDDPALVNDSKLAILIASLVAAVSGYTLLHLTLKSCVPTTD
jgi:NhaA family Na+:H+ antiporter